MRAAAREQRRPQVKTDTTVMKSASLELAGDAEVPNLAEPVSVPTAKSCGACGTGSALLFTK